MWQSLPCCQRTYPSGSLAPLSPVPLPPAGARVKGPALDTGPPHHPPPPPAGGLDVGKIPIQGGGYGAIIQQQALRRRMAQATHGLPGARRLHLPLGRRLNRVRGRAGDPPALSGRPPHQGRRPRRQPRPGQPGHALPEAPRRGPSLPPPQGAAIPAAALNAPERPLFFISRAYSQAAPAQRTRSRRFNSCPRSWAKSQTSHGSR